MYQLAAEDTADGCIAFYTIMQRDPPPPHAVQWIRDIFRAKEEGRGVVIEAFRGSTKSATVMRLVQHQIGCHPDKSNLIVQLNDRAASKTTSKIATEIEHNVQWRRIFPHIKPDTGRGWSERGYWVWDDQFAYGEWQRKLGADPTLSGWGYTSGSILGLHPTGVLAIDDIHDRGNTYSDRELEAVLEIIRGTILPTLVPGSFKIVIGTPWRDNDALAFFKSLPGQFLHVRTPLTKEVWPERFTPEEIEAVKELSTEVEFAQMYLLDLEKAKGINLKREWLHQFQAKDIMPSWVFLVGVDYASSADALAAGKDADYTAIAQGYVTLDGRLVVQDGFRGRISQADAESRLVSLASAYPTLKMIAVEAIGTGKEFYHVLLRSQKYMPLMPIHSHKGQRKGDRFQDFLAKMFQQGRILLSDQSTEFLRVFVDEWVGWPEAKHDDTLDAVYMLVAAAAQYGFVTAPQLQVAAKPSSLYTDKVRDNPFSGFGGNW